MSSRKTVLITGSSIGIGQATAEFFHKNGWQVVATMRNPDAGKELAKLDNVLVTKLDVTDEASIASAVSKKVTPHSWAVRMSLIACSLPVAGPRPKLNPMQPRPRADTSRLLLPNLRFCICALRG